MTIIQFFANKPGLSGVGGIGADPMLWLHELGMACLSFGLSFFMETLIIIMVLAGLSGVCKAVQPVDSMFQQFSDWIRPFVLMIAGMFVGIGVVLGFVTPLYPLFLFTFGVIAFFYYDY